MKKLLSFFLIAVLGLSLSAQVISDFPAIEDFEGATNPGSHDFFLNWTDDWVVTDAPANINSPITNGYNSYNFVYCYSNSSALNDTLETYAFNLTGTDHATLSFYFANPDWQGDYDELKIGYRQAAWDNWTFIYTINEANDDWTLFEVPLPTGSMLQICFVALTNRGYGLYLDDIKVDIPDFPEVSSFPWSWDFDNGMEPFMQEFDGLYSPWYIALGNTNSDEGTMINAPAYDYNDYNALFFNTSGRTATLISPILKLGNADSASVTFYYSMEDYDGDVDEFALLYRTSPSSSWQAIWATTEEMNVWRVKTFNLPPDLTDTYQIGFWARGNYGYGVTLDMITVKARAPEGITEMTSAQSAISVYPNPATDHITVIRNNNDEMFIYNVFGSLVKSTNENIINVSDFAPGVYFIKTSEGTVKFVKSK